jgi:hypothetical protein
MSKDIVNAFRMHATKSVNSTSTKHLFRRIYSVWTVKSSPQTGGGRGTICFFGINDNQFAFWWGQVLERCMASYRNILKVCKPCLKLIVRIFSLSKKKKSWQSMEEPKTTRNTSAIVKPYLSSRFYHQQPIVSFITNIYSIVLAHYRSLASFSS